MVTSDSDRETSLKSSELAAQMRTFKRREGFRVGLRQRSEG